MELLEQIGVLLTAQIEWTSTGRTEAGALRNLHEQCVCLMNGLYIDTISEYLTIAERRGIRSDSGALIVLTRMSHDLELLKSYPSEFDAGLMTKWLNSISNCDSHADELLHCHNLSEWAEALISEGFQLSTSSGVGGRMSLVPRDAVTSALAGLFSDCVFKGELRRRGIELADSRCLAFSARNHTAGMSQFCRYLEEQSKAICYVYEALGDAAKIDQVALAEFVADATQDRAPLLILATAERLNGCIHEIESIRRIGGPVVVVLGGGWMTRDGRRLERRTLYADIDSRLGIGQDRIIESYSLAECCAIFYRCEHDRFHIPPQVWPHVLTRHGEFTSVGKGRLAVSDPVNMTTIGFLITDDLVDLRDDECQCGRQGYSIVGSIKRWVAPRALST